MQADPGVVTGRAVAVGAAGERNPHLANARDGRCVGGGLRPVFLEEGLAVERHAILDVDRAAQGREPLEGRRLEPLAVIEPPTQILKRHLAVHLLEHVEHAARRRVEGGVLAERPALPDDELHDGGEVLLHDARWRHRIVLGEIGDVPRRVENVFARSDHAVVVRSLAELHELGPGRVVLQLLAGRLREQRVADPQRHLPVRGELRDRGVVVRIILAAAARVDHAGDAQPVVLAHEVARRENLVLRRKPRDAQPHRDQAREARRRHHQARGTARSVALDRAAEHVGRVLRPAERADPGAVEPGAVVEVHDHARRVARRRVDLLERRVARFRELRPGPAADHLHPVRRGRALRLLAHAAQGFGERRHAVPAHFVGVSQTAPDEVGVPVVQARDDGAPARVDHPSVRAAQAFDLGR